MINVQRQVQRNRPALTLAVLVVFCLVSLGSGTESTIIHRGVKRIIALTTYPVIKAQNWITKTASGSMEYVFNAGRMRRENATLHEEVIRLGEEAARGRELALQNQRLREQMDFVREATRFDVIPATVLESYKGMLKIDLGLNAGIAPNMSVIAPGGVVGVVIEVADFSANVATLHHPDCKVGAMVQRNRLRAYDGVIHAGGSDLSQICTMYYIDIKHEVRVGDAVVTTPESIFPSGYPIGVVSAVNEGEALWKWAEITPAVDPYSLDEVFVVLHSTPKPEDLEGPPLDPTVQLVAKEAPLADEPAAAAPKPKKEALPPPPADTRPTQERFAP